MFSNLTVKMRLSLLLGFLIVAMLAIGSMGLWALQGTNTTFDTLRDGYMRPMQQLARMEKVMLRSRLDLTSAAMAKNAKETATRIDQVAKYVTEADNDWRNYLPTVTLDEEKQLAKKTDLSRMLYVREGLDPVIKALKDGNYEAADALLIKTVRPLFSSYEKSSIDLIEFQFTGAAKEVGDAHARYAMVRNASVGLIAAAVVLALLFGILIVRFLTRALGGEPAAAAEVATKIAAGDLSMNIALRPGDATSLMACMKTMQASVQALVKDAGMLADAAKAGKLSTRADASKHQGDFNSVVSGVNQTLDAVIGPLNVAAS